MSSEPPSDVRNFLREYEGSVHELQVLLLLRRTARPRTAAELATVVSRSATEVADDLESLFKRGLVDGGGGGYRYAPRDPRVDSVIAQLADNRDIEDGGRFRTLLRPSVLRTGWATRDPE
jgi:hypothetical protein